MLNEQAAKLPAGSEGLIVLLYFMGERSPIWDSDAKGTIVGLSLAHTKAHLYRAFLEAVAYSLRDAMNATGEGLGKYILLAGIGTGLGIYGIFGTVFAMQPDAIDYSEWKKNRSISGTIAAFQGLFVKASMGLASWVIGLYLGMNGYDGAASTQVAAAQSAIQFCYMWIPVILCVLLAVTNVFWTLDACAVEMRAELNARREKLQELIDKWRVFKLCSVGRPPRTFPFLPDMDIKRHRAADPVLHRSIVSRLAVRPGPPLSSKYRYHSSPGG